MLKTTDENNRYKYHLPMDIYLNHDTVKPNHRYQQVHINHVFLLGSQKNDFIEK